ncbi:MAG TPA: hypothetical protein VEJ63_22575 [Planctomycetota bacterium]|nr:hypothetical protein [Planctomycetota bacterium]
MRFRERHDGIFQAAYRAKRDPRLSVQTRADIRAALQWFEEHLPAPKLTDGRAIFWFKPDADEALKHMTLLAVSLRMLSVPVLQKYARRPGFIVFEDTFQVAAVPDSARRACIHP